VIIITTSFFIVAMFFRCKLIGTFSWIIYLICGSGFFGLFAFVWSIFNKEMVRFIKPGRVVLLLSGRFAGKKAVVVRAYDEGTKDRPFGHALVVGIEKPP
jgi:hypothetical protein